MSLLPSTHSNDLKILRGIAKFAPKNSNGTKQSAMNLSPSSEMSVSMATETTQYVSAESGVNEILDTTLISVSRTGALTCNKMADDVKALFLIADAGAIAQASGSVTGEQTSYIFPNRSVQLGGSVNSGAGVFGISSVTVSSYEGANAADAAVTTAYVVGDVVVPATPNDHWYMATVAGTSAGSAPTWPTNGSTVTDGTVTWQDMGLIDYTVTTDYELDDDYAIINILGTGAIATAVSRVPASLRNDGITFHLSVDYTRSAQTVNQVATKSAANLEGEFWFYEQNPKGGNSVWYAPSATLSPNGDFALKSGSEYGAVGFGLTFQTPPTGSGLYIDGVPAGLT